MTTVPQLILGIDPSLTATGLCLCLAYQVTQPPRLLLTITTSQMGLARLRTIADAVAYNAESAMLTVMEGISMGSRGMLDQLAGLHWLIRDRLITEPLIVAPSQLKKFVLGSGKGEKSMMLREVFRRWNIVAANDNEADAAGLAMIGRAYLDESCCDNQAQREVIAALKAGPKTKRVKAR